MCMDELKSKPLPAIPEDIQTQLDHSSITLTAFEDKNDIIQDTSLQQEVGYRRFPDGRALLCGVPKSDANIAKAVPSLKNSSAPS